MKAFLSYVFPATLLHFGLVLLYDLIWIAGFAGSFFRWWLGLGDQRPTVFIGGYLGLVLVVATLGITKRWSMTLRWVLELGSRRGLLVGGVPVLDIGLLILIGGIGLVILTLAEQVAELYLYQVGPLAFSLSLNLIFGFPPQLNVVAEREQSLAELARAMGYNPAALVDENNVDPQKGTAMIRFAQEVRLPLDSSASRGSAPAPPVTPSPTTAPPRS